MLGLPCARNANKEMPLQVANDEKLICMLANAIEAQSTSKHKDICPFDRLHDSERIVKMSKSLLRKNPHNRINADENASLCFCPDCITNRQVPLRFKLQFRDGLSLCVCACVSMCHILSLKARYLTSGMRPRTRRP